MSVGALSLSYSPWQQNSLFRQSKKLQKNNNKENYFFYAIDPGILGK